MISPNDILPVAAQHNLPPALIFALASRDNLKPEELEPKAQMLAQLFREHGDWEQALSVMKSGDPNIHENPNNPAAGWVNSILGIAGSRADYGMDKFTPSDAETWQSHAEAFNKSLMPLLEMGGVVTPEIVGNFLGHMRRTIPAQDVPPTNQPVEAQAQKLSEQRGPDPKKVAEFIQKAKPLGIDPEHFIENYPFAAAMSRKMLDQSMSLEQFAPLNGMPKQMIQEHIAQQPHPIYPDVTAGQFHKAFEQAAIHSGSIGRMPNSREAYRFAISDADNKVMAQYYTPPQPKEVPVAATPPAGAPPAPAATSPPTGPKPAAEQKPTGTEGAKPQGGGLRVVK